jgi:shikimate kinase
MNLYLIGYRGTGKSTLAKALSQSTGRPFADTDALVVDREKRAVPDIFRDRGEAYFRKLEKEVLLEASRMERTIISTGGGIVLDADNRKAMRATGKCVYLRADPDVIFKRTSGDKNRPSLTGSPIIEEIHTLLRKREPLYAELSDLTLDTGALKIEECLQALLKSAVLDILSQG